MKSKIKWHYESRRKPNIRNVPLSEGSCCNNVSQRSKPLIESFCKLNS
nr:MAG TPA: hypothetical protein [Bacteriophage sp.]